MSVSSADSTMRTAPNPVLSSPRKRPLSPSTSMALPFVMCENAKSLTHTQWGAGGSGSDSTCDIGSTGSGAAAMAAVAASAATALPHTVQRCGHPICSSCLLRFSGRWRELASLETPRHEKIPLAHPLAVDLRPEEQDGKGKRSRFAVSGRDVKVRPVPAGAAGDEGVDRLDLHPVVAHHVFVERADLLAADEDALPLPDRDDIRGIEVLEDRRRVMRGEGTLLEVVLRPDRLLERGELRSGGRGCAGRGRRARWQRCSRREERQHAQHEPCPDLPHDFHATSSACWPARSPSSAAVSHICAPLSSEWPKDSRAKRLRSTSLPAGLPSLPKKKPGGSTT